MTNNKTLWFLITTVGLLSSCVVLYIANVNKNIWLLQLISFFICFTLIAFAKHATSDKLRNTLIILIMGLTLILLWFLPAMGAFSSSSRLDTNMPSRWLTIGAFHLYLAPVLLPMFFIAASTVLKQVPKLTYAVLFVIFTVAAAIAFQPDASQVLAFSLGVIGVLISANVSKFQLTSCLVTLVLVNYYAFIQPDRLSPVPYVEEVFVLAFGQSVWIGLLVITLAVGMLYVLFVLAKRGHASIYALIIYYATLYVCSLWGITPAPMIGYGAGPILGLGLAALTSQILSKKTARQQVHFRANQVT